MPPRSSTALLGLWSLSSIAAQLAGLLALGGALWALTPPHATAVTSLVGWGLLPMLGAVHGAVVGYLQWWTWRRELSQVAASDWVTTTAAGSLLGWLTLLGVLAVTGASHRPEPGSSWVLLLGGMTATIVVSLPQTFSLRSELDEAALRRPATATAWASVLVLALSCLLLLVVWPRDWMFPAAAAAGTILGTVVGSIGGGLLEGLLAVGRPSVVQHRDVATGLLTGT